MDLTTIFSQYGQLLQVFVPARALPYVAVILLLVWLAYQYSQIPKKLAPALAMALGLAVAFFFLEMPWKEAIPTGLTLGGYRLRPGAGGRTCLNYLSTGRMNRGLPALTKYNGLKINALGFGPGHFYVLTRRTKSVKITIIINLRG